MKDQRSIKTPVLPAVAYLTALIRTDSLPAYVADVLIMSDEQPTQVGMQTVWAVLAEQHGKDFQQAHARMRQHVESSPLFAWVRPYLQRHERGSRG